jgi:hypothetical protein
MNITQKTTLGDKIKTSIYNFLQKHKLTSLLLEMHIKRKSLNTDASENWPGLYKATNSIFCEFEVFPFFGTLLHLKRDKKILWADDFDFATFNKGVLSAEFIDRLEQKGLYLNRLTFVDDHLLELSFNFNGANVDIFILENTPEHTIHKCPDFRKSVPKVLFGSPKIYLYERYFKVEYPVLNLNFDEDLSLITPKNYEDFFRIHYGSDWKTPKKSNFINYSGYSFHQGEALIICGSKEYLRPLVRKNM